MPLEYDLRKTDLALRPNRFLLNSASVPVGSHKSHKWLMEGGPLPVEWGSQSTWKWEFKSLRQTFLEKKSSHLAFQP